MKSRRNFLYEIISTKGGSCAVASPVHPKESVTGVTRGVPLRAIPYFTAGLCFEAPNLKKIKFSEIKEVIINFDRQ